MIPVKSSLIKAIGYDEDTQKLTINFKTGGKYVYSEVPPAVWEAFRAAESVGRFFSANIKGGYSYEKAE